VSEHLDVAVERFVAHKRAVGRKYNSEEHELRLLARFARQRGVRQLAGVTPAFLEEFLASRPRQRPRSFNHLLGAVRCLLDWAVANELLAASPLQTRRRRVTAVRVPFLLDSCSTSSKPGARWLPHPPCRTTRVLFSAAHVGAESPSELSNGPARPRRPWRLRFSAIRRSDP